MKPAGILLTATLLASLGAAAPPKLRLPTDVAPVQYRADLTLDPDKDTFAGTISIDLQVKQPTSQIWLNANRIVVESATISANGKSIAAKPMPGGDDFVGLALESELPAGRAEITIAYTGRVRLRGSAGVFRAEDEGNHYLFTQFESTDARAAFPCFDEPGYKVPWQLTLHVPASDTAISNTPILSESTSGATKTYEFTKTKPLPSYLVAFGVGPFEYVDGGTAGKNHVPIRIVTPKGRSGEAKFAAQVTATILTRLEDYFGIPYPYEKSDQVALPSIFGFGAMENAGMVTYAQTILLAKPDNDTIAHQRGYVTTAAHELAHQWFGDLVTPSWWNDIWLNEAFATWMEQKLVAEWKPEWDTRLSDVRSKLRVEEEDSLLSARKIRQEIESKNDISNAFDGITYQKGAAVIGMFENWVGVDDFRKGVQSYLKQYAFRNASAGDFLDSLSTASRKNVGQAFSTFLNQAGVPLVSVKLECTQNRPTLHLKQERFLPLGSKGDPQPQVWNVPVCMSYGGGDATHHECTVMTQPAQDWVLKANSCPTWVEGNQDAVGYYVVNYEGDLLSALTREDIDHRLNPAERIDLMGDAESLVDGGRLSRAKSLSLVEVFHGDPAPQVIQSAIRLALTPREQLVPDSLKPNYQRFLLKNFQARAHELGWTAKPDERDAVKLLRSRLLPMVAVDGGDRELAHDAQQLTAKWFEDHHALRPDIVAGVLTTAAAYGDKGLCERFLAEYKSTRDRQDRQRIRAALASFRDPESIQVVLNALLSGEIPMIEGGNLLMQVGQDDRATRRMAFDFVKAHFDEIIAKRPVGGGSDFGARLPRVGSAFCAAESRNELESFFQPRIAKFDGGPRILSQVLEGIDVCIADKAAQQAGVSEFLTKY